MKTAIQEKILETILYRAEADWSEPWLNRVTSEIFENFKLHPEREIIEFYNELARYAIKNCAIYAGHVALGDIQEIVDEMFNEMKDSVSSKAHVRLMKRFGQPREIDSL